MIYEKQNKNDEAVYNFGDLRADFVKDVNNAIKKSGFNLENRQIIKEKILADLKKARIK